MAVFDRIRNGLKGVRGQDSGVRGQGSGVRGIPEAYEGMQNEGMNQAQQIDALLRSQTSSVQDARRQGEKDAAEAYIRDAGMTLNREKGTRADDGRIMNRERLNEATKLLLQYKAGKASVDRRVVKAQQWWKLRNWEQIEANRGTKGAQTKKSNTAWLWNCIIGKHADYIDAYPEPVILPREQGDKEEAQKLSKIVPVVLQMNGFEDEYNSAGWQKLQEGTGVYGVFWDPNKLNGLGDISIKKENIMNLFWEPGVDDIQDSRNVFFCTLMDKDVLIGQYPELQGQLKVNKLSLEKYRTDDNVDLDKKCVVIDWYYHTYEGPRKILQYCKYVDEICLYSSEEEAQRMAQDSSTALGMTQGALGMTQEAPGMTQGAPGMTQGTGISGMQMPAQPYKGFYEHGLYPFVLDPMYPVEGSPAGYGMIDIAKDTQTDIDTLSQAMVLNAACRATPRYFTKKDGAINEEEFADWSKPFVHTSGMLGEDSLKPVEVLQMGSEVQNLLQQKIDEIKFVTGNTDVNNGGVPSGVTAASAIAALKEDSGRSSKDSSKASYRAYSQLVNMVIELIRQFYDIPRQFRIIGQDGNEEFTTYDNSMIQPQPVFNGGMAEDGMRLPVFDIEVRSQRENAYTKMSQNELAIQFYNMGVLNPQNTDTALMLIEMMDFRGKEELRQKIQANGTIQDTLMQVAQIAMALAEKYDPAIAQQLGMILQGVAADTGMQQMAQAGGGAAPAPAALGSGDAMAKASDANENALVRRAKERAANASRPG